MCPTSPGTYRHTLRSILLGCALFGLSAMLSPLAARGQTCVHQHCHAQMLPTPYPSPSAPPDVVAFIAPLANTCRDPGRLSPTQNETLANFLVRVAFISGEARDRDEAGWRKLHTHVLDVLRVGIIPITSNIGFCFGGASCMRTCCTCCGYVFL